MCSKKFLYAKVARAGNRTDPTKKQKDYGINTAPTHSPFFYSVSFWFFNPPLLRDAYKIFTYAQAASYHFQQAFISLSFQ